MCAQLALVVILFTMGWLDPRDYASDTGIAQTFIVGALLIAVASATQDIVIDAVRVEMAEPSIQACTWLDIEWA